MGLTQQLDSGGATSSQVAQGSLLILFGRAGSSLLCGLFSSCVGGGCGGLFFVVVHGLLIAMASLVV